MISNQEFLTAAHDAGIQFFAGVPDSLLKDICAYITDTVPSSRHIIAANEGGAVALAAGHYLATGSSGLVYLQNSGLGNCINPLLSLADPEVYSIPMMLLIGWRGEPGKKDEPQHVKQGKVTLSLLDAMDIPYIIIDSATTDVAKKLSDIAGVMRQRSAPVAVVVREGAFEKYKQQHQRMQDLPMVREDALSVILHEVSGPDDIIVSTTGKTSREIFEFRARAGQHHGSDFLTVGSMGHASQIALSIALAKPGKHICCIDGDGAALMHLGAMAINGCSGAENYLHILINNGAHDSVGGQPTVGQTIDMCSIARASGYRHAESVAEPAALKDALHRMKALNGMRLLEIRVRTGARENLGRPTRSTFENKNDFMRFIEQ